MARIKNKALFWFASFNFLIFTTVFLGRILRDSLLFTTPGGDKYFPIVLIINAVLMTWFGGKIGLWWEKQGAKNLLIYAFGGSALWFFTMGIVLQYQPPTFVVALFYLGSELPIFLAMNLIWILADDYFSEQGGQRDFPQISAVGQLGIVLASLLMLSQNSALIPEISSEKMLFGVSALNFLLLLCSLTILRKLDSIRSSTEWLPATLDNHAEDATTSVSFLQQAKADRQWAKQIRFLWLFTLATVCNFVLLGIFDQTLANGAAANNIDAGELGQLIAKWTLGFGIAAAFFQWFIFPALLDKLGVAKLNLFAPTAMLIGTLSYLIFADDFFSPIWTRIEFDPVSSMGIINILLFARICGWVAEFLFNQTLLPLVYGALPSDKVSRGRFFVEGPVTAVTNGVAGLFLLVYFTFFQTSNSATGFKLDLLFMVAFVAAIFMLYWSVQMVPEFKNILLERLRQGDDVDLEQYEKEFGEIDKEAWHGIAEIPLRNATTISTVAQLRGTDSVPQLLNAFHSGNDDIKAAVVEALIQLNAREAFVSVWPDLHEPATPPSTQLIETMANGAKHFGLLAQLLNCFERWLKLDCSPDHVSAMVGHILQMGADGNFVIRDLLERYSTDNNDIATVKVMLALKSGKSYRKIAQLPAINGDLMQMDWSKLAETEFFLHEDALDALAFMASQCHQADSNYGRSIVSLLERYPWLVWPLLYLVDKSLQDHSFVSSASLKPVVPELPQILLRAFKNNEIDLTSVNLFHAVKSSIGATSAPEFASLDWSQFDLFYEGLTPCLARNTEKMTLFQYFNYQLSIMSFETWDVALTRNCILAWYESGAHNKDSEFSNTLFVAAQRLYQKFVIAYALRCLFDKQFKTAEQWLQCRIKQLLQSYLTLTAGLHPETRNVFRPIEIAADLLANEPVRYDRALSFLQEGLPRDIFNRLRDDLAVFKLRLVEGRGNIPHLPEDLPARLDYSGAKELWQAVPTLLGDALLISIMNDEVKHA